MMEHFLAREPAGLDRVEFAIATLSAMYANTHRGESAPVRGVEDFLPFRKAWPEIQSGRYSEADLQVLKALG